MDAVCKGSWALGSACGECSRCEGSAIDFIHVLQARIDRVAKIARQQMPEVIQVDSGGNPIGYDGGKLVVGKAILESLGLQK